MLSMANEKNIIDINEINAIRRFRGYYADEMMETECLMLLPSENRRDLQSYHEHLVSEGDFFLQYGFEMTDEILPQCDFESNGVICYTIFLKTTGEMIGYIGLDGKRCDESNLEFYIFKKHRNKGYCKEAAMRLLDAFFNGEIKGLKGNRVVAETFFENEPCKAALLALGFRSEGLGIRVVSDDDDDDEYIAEGMVVAYVLESKKGMKAA